MSNKFSQQSTHQTRFLGSPKIFKHAFTGVNGIPVTQKSGRENSWIWKSKYFKSDLLGEWPYRWMYKHLHTTRTWLHTTRTWQTTSSTFKRCADLCTHTFHVVCMLMTFVQIYWGSSAHTQMYDIWEFCTQHVHDTQVEHVRVVHLHVHASIYSVYVFEYA